MCQGFNRRAMHMTVKGRTRHCHCCDSEFTEKRSDSDKQWESRKFCSPLCGNKAEKEKVSIYERLKRFQIRKEGCWEWTGSTDRRGYGQIAVGSRQSPRKAHRVSYEEAFGEIPEGLSVLHRCDNPPCTNPDHLFVGTQKDNMIDCSKKGRINPKSLKNLNPGKTGYLGASWARGSENGTRC